jgi:serine/threonine protein kinase
MTVQISSALVYLHDMLIIYRDLKSDNILVWKFPKSNRFTKDCVLIKLADYSISRCVLPTGTKGFAGTEGYMSPEIIRYNGEEAYTNKIDCFSFGMLLYEIIALKHPFENNEQIKDIVLNGGRPLIRSQVFGLLF